MSVETSVRLRPLSLVDEGDEVLLGDPDTGVFVALPAVGGVVVAALQRGATLTEAGTEAQAFAGEPVDIASFVESLRELGFVDDDGQDVDRREDTRTPVRTAPIQGRRWLAGVRPQLIRPLFSAPAWAFYAACAVFSVAAFIAWPALFPNPAGDAFALGGIGLGTILLVPFAMGSAALHECGHWLAARAIGIQARFGIDQRLTMLVFETDLTQLWTVPRRRRYGPLLAGMAVDTVLLAMLLGGRVLIHTGVWSPPALVDSILAVWVFVKLTGLLWQCMIFLRTDLYAVLVNAMGCRNLWAVKSLLLRRAFGRLTSEQAADLAGAAPADLRVGRWFRWVWLAGTLGVVTWFAYFLLPVIVVELKWAATGVARGPLTGQFWYAVACTLLLLSQQALAIVLAVREHLLRVITRRRSPRTS